MATHNESEFEREICEYLAAHGWLCSPNDAGYDRERALYPADLFGWLEDTQPEALAKAVTPNADGALKVKQQAAVLDRVAATLDIPLDNGGGTLNALRGAVGVVGAGPLKMATFKPDTTLNAAENEKYSKMRLRVMRQVHFSTADNRSIDLVLFLNGIPVATLELKTDFTQSVNNAIEQYKKDRDPKEKSGKRNPLLDFGRRALVHFAVSNSEVWMTTRLNGTKTHFLPFNRGFDDGKGNPPAEYVEGEAGTSATSYLWEQILQRDTWLNILGKMMVVKTETEHDPITGAVKKSTTLLFPRFHQWEVVTGLTDAVLAEGPGHRYLIQHSAGSGKTNSIAWTASRFARLQTEHADGTWSKVFDKVIIVVDRTVLDGQLQNAIRKIDGQPDIVATISDQDVRKAGAKSKSDLLAKALLNNSSHIVAVTIQTFPFAMDAIRANKGLKGKKFAVIADEAHSSQSGQIASKLKAVLTAEEIKDLGDGGEIDVEAVLAAEAAERADSKDISYFAFTATPKNKTLELFGRPGPDGKPVPFHLYSMKQAIEEGFILDVLKGYQTYETAFKIAQKAGVGSSGAGDAEVDQNAATKGLMKWVKLHPTNIASKVRIIVEHFHANVAHLLDGHAKAMVVTDSRKAAVRYKKAIDDYIAKRLAEDPTYDYKTLVAFSGAVDDPDTGPEPFTEATMNPGVYDLAATFATPGYRVMLVANKFQTGFDQPLLSAMYVDKKLSGVTAVQTLSRLNRTYFAPSGEKKEKTFVLDFANKADDIRLAFEPYFRGAYLETSTDPYVVVNLATKLAQAGLYTKDQVRQAAEIWLLGKGHNALMAAVAPAKHDFEVRYKAALDQKDKASQDELDMFRKDVGTYVRLYDFMSQIVNYGDSYLEMLSIYLRLLERVIAEGAWAVEIDLSDVTLQRLRQVKGDAVDISLGAGGGLSGVTAAGSATKKDPKMVALQEVIERLNDLFGDGEFAESDNRSFVETLIRRLLLVETVKQQIKVNSAKQFEESPDLTNLILETIADTQGEQNKRADYFFGTGVEVEDLLRSIKTTLYRWGGDEASEALGTVVS